MISNDTDALQDEPVRECVACDAGIEADKWHIATTERSADGTITIRSFCSEACRDQWEGQ